MLELDSPDQQTGPGHACSSPDDNLKSQTKYFFKAIHLILRHQSALPTKKALIHHSPLLCSGMLHFPRRLIWDLSGCCFPVPSSLPGKQIRRKKGGLHLRQDFTWYPLSPDLRQNEDMTKKSHAWLLPCMRFDDSYLSL